MRKIELIRDSTKQLPAKDINMKYKYITLIVLLVLITLVYTIPKPRTVESTVESIVVIKEEIQVEISIQDYAKQQVEERFGIGHWESFYQIIRHESQWKHLAQNPTSTAYGLCQTMMSLYEQELDDDFRTNEFKQIDWCINYTGKRYGTPNKAWDFWKEKRYW